MLKTRQTVSPRFRENTLSIQSGIQNLTVSTSELKDANQVISDSVQTLSAISEELTAHAHETLEAENKKYRYP